MYTGGEDCTAKIWDLKMRNLSCQVAPLALSSIAITALTTQHHVPPPLQHLATTNRPPQRIFQANAAVTCVCLHPNQQEMVVGDQSGVIHMWNLQVLVPPAWWWWWWRWLWRWRWSWRCWWWLRWWS